MAKIEMDVTEYDALRKNITLLEESKKETAELNKQIDALKEEKLQVFRDVQMKVVKTTTIENITRTVGVRGTNEFNHLVKNLVDGILNRFSRNDPHSHREQERNYQERNYREMQRWNVMGKPSDSSHFHPTSMHASSALEFVEYELSSFLNRLITTTSIKEGEPVYVGLEEVKTELYTKLLSNQDKKTKDLLALEPDFNDFSNKKAQLESMTNTLLKEKLELDTALTSAKEDNTELRKQNEKIGRVQDLYEESLTDMNTIILSDKYFFAKSLITDLRTYLVKLNEKVNKN